MHIQCNYIFTHVSKVTGRSVADEEENVGPVPIYKYICTFNVIIIYTHVPEVTGSSVADEEETLDQYLYQYMYTIIMYNAHTCT